MEKDKFEKKFEQVKRKYRQVAIHFDNTDTVYANCYQFVTKDTTVLWLKWHYKKICLTELTHIIGVY